MHCAPPRYAQRLEIQAAYEGINDPAGVIRWQQIIQAQRKQRALTATFAGDVVHKENALGVSEGMFTCSRFSVYVSGEF